MFTKMVENCRQVMVCGVDEFVVAYMHIICPGSWVEFIALVAGLFLDFVLFLTCTRIFYGEPAVLSSFGRSAL